MRRLSLVIFTLALMACAPMPPRPAAPDVAAVVQMARDKVAAKDIIQRMHDAGAVYRLSASQLARLREQGVPDEVIDYMQHTWLSDVRRDTAARMFPYEPWPPGFGTMHGPFWPHGRGLRHPWGW